MTSFIRLPDRGLMIMRGSDTRGFLQGLVTVDMRTVLPCHPRYGALLSPQGRFLHDFFLMERREDILIDAEAARLPDLIGRLKLYRLRAEVEFENAPMEVTSLPEHVEAEPPEGMLLIRDPRHEAMGWRLYAPVGAGGAWCEAQGWRAGRWEDYERGRLEFGIPDGGRDFIVDRSLALECGLDALHGVDFDKGCYVGQEVTARSRFRAQLRKSLYRVMTEDTLPAAGTPVMQNGKEVGTLRSSLGAIGLAILQREAVEMSGQPSLHLTAGGIAVRAELPAWLGPGESAG